jgi:hypothetical protein
MGRHDTRRRFEQWAKNPDCEANTISAVAGVSMADVAQQEGLKPTMGQSPYALARGTTFERALFANGATRLIDALVEADVLSTGSSGFVDLRLRMNGGPIKDHAEATKRTTDLLKEAGERGVAGLKDLPCLISSATLSIPGQPVMLPDGIVAIDALVLRPTLDGQAIELVIGEIKTYPDRAGYTDAADLASTRAQAGVYLHGLRLAVAHLDLEVHLRPASRGFLVLTRAGRNDPSVRAAEDLEFQAKRAQKGFVRLRKAATGLQPFDEKDEAEAIIAVQGGATAYNADCLTFCDRAAGCRQRAEEVGDAAFLGEDVKRFLGSTPLPRAIELLNGASPSNATEQELLDRMASASAGAS